ncbi:MAG: HD domain-containing protein [Deltaproteobacteria bacterium]
MTFLQNTESCELLGKVLHLSRKKKIKLYLVGGLLRDEILGRRRENPDIDFCLKRGAIPFGKHLAKIIRSGFVVLDKERGYCRLVKKLGRRFFTLDFTDFRGRTLEDDLLHRDFTINAMAMELEKMLESGSPQELIDPYGGRLDLKKKIIRIVHKENFVDDPLRIMRAFSLSAIFGFKIYGQTLRLMKRDSLRLKRISYERIRDELFKILDCPQACGYLLQMDKLRILSIIMPEIEVMRGLRQGPYHHLDVWKHSLETVRQMEILFWELKKNKEIQGYLHEVISADRKRLSLMKLAALLHDIGKPKALRHKGKKTIFHGHERIGADITEEIIRRLKLSNDELQALHKMVFWHLRPGYLGDSETVSSRAKFRYFRDTAQEGVSTLLLSIADQRSTRGRLTSEEDRARHERVCFGLIKEYFREGKKAKPMRLLNGDDLMKKFKLTPSPLIGKVLSELEELQAIGRIRTKKDALAAAKKLIK